MPYVRPEIRASSTNVWNFTGTLARVKKTLQASANQAAQHEEDQQSEASRRRHLGGLALFHYRLHRDEKLLGP